MSSTIIPGSFCGHFYVSRTRRASVKKRNGRFRLTVAAHTLYPSRSTEPLANTRREALWVWRPGVKQIEMLGSHASGAAKLTALNPMGQAPAIEQLGMAPRPGTLDGKTVYLVDVHFVDGDKLLQQMQAWFAEHLPQVRTVLASKAGVYTEDDPKLFAEIRDSQAAAVMAVGH
jgi:hypothetical protein